MDRMRWLRENGLSLTLLALFALSMLGQMLAGWRSYDEERRQHHESAVTLPAYLTSGSPPAYSSLRHRFAGRQLQGGGGWTRRLGRARGRRGAAPPPGGTGPTPAPRR